MGKQSREKRERLAGRSSAEGEREVGRFKFQSGLEKACLFIITWGTYLVLFTPLLINTQFFFPFVAPKTIFFRIIVEIILLAYLFLVLADRRYRPRINTLTIALTVFLGIFILASFTGINLHRSFWSTNERMTGIFTMLHLFAFFLILTSTFKERKEWERALGVSIIVGVILSIHILLGSQVSTRGGGTIGNTSFMAAYLLFDIFFAVILFFAKRGFWQIFSGVSLAVMFPVLFTSSARGAVFSFWGGLFLLGLGFLIFSRKLALKRLALAIVLALVIFVIFSVIIQPSFVKDEVVTILKEMSSRFAVWETGWKGFLERPIQGWGPENFIVVFTKYFNPCMFSSCGGEIWFDRVHNIVLDTLVTTGLVGLLSYLAIFGVAIYGLLRLIPKIQERRHIFFPLGLIVLLLVYFFQNLFVFDMINTYLVFFLTLGFIGFLTQHQPVEEKEVKIKRVNSVFGSLIVIVTIFVLWLGNIQPLIANHYLIKTVGTQDVEQLSPLFQKSLSSWMEKYESREYFARKIMGAADSSIEGKNREVIRAAFDLAEIEMEKSVKENPLDFRPRLFLGQLYLQCYRFTSDPEKLTDAQQTLEESIQLSPTNQQGYWNLAEVKFTEGKIDETIGLFKKAIALEPGVGQSHWYLAMAYKIAGQNQLAKEELVKTEELGYDWHNNLERLKEAIKIYNALGEDNNLLPLYLKATDLAPNDAQFWAALAATYANLGQFDEAAKAAQKVIELNPDLAPKVEKFLEALPQ